MVTILATGGLGFVGSHCSIQLLNNGFDVCIVDSLINSSEENLTNIKKILSLNKDEFKGKLFFKKGDVRNIKFMDEIFKEFSYLNKPIVSVFHFAGLKSVEESFNNPLKYWDHNINAALGVLHVMNKNHCNNFIFSSSATIYKPENDKKLLETFFKEPINAYGNSKLTIERMLEDLYKSDNGRWKIANLRYFNPAGAHQTGLIGESPSSLSSNLFPIMLEVASKKREKLYIYGNDWPTRDGTCIRDYIHIMDLADAHIAAFNLLNKSKSQILNLNIGTGQGASVLDVFNTFTRVNKIKIDYEYTSRRPGDPPYVVADNSLALKILNWKPQKSLEDMCIDSWKWIQKSRKFN